ncbi:MAG TPA: IS110 family transposase [Candidatus Acidoferrales bacterium]|nr:IS110 family transposase [Candidatus Acidoferrales bacterium]
MAGIDLHSNNLVIGIMDMDGKRVASQKLSCKLKEVVDFLSPFKKRLEQVAVESTYNWYWLVDGLQRLGYPVVLANPAGMEQYSGIKHADDTNDAFFLAELLRLKILPTGHIYDEQLRPVRDLLRRRMSLVHQRTALMLSFKSLYTRTTGQEMSLGELKELAIKEAQALYDHPANQLIAGMQIKHIEQLTESIEKIEEAVLDCARELPFYSKLTTLPGVGTILGMTITMEVGEIKRFAEPGHLASYCRTVAANRMSNRKKKGENNSKCGNKYLAWAFVEGANFARRYNEQCRRWFERKAAKTNNLIATKALACKLAKAAWHVMAEGTDYDSKRMFGQAGSKK